MKISIVTPVFNGEKYIRRTIDSIVRQTHPDIEYIVVDGASTDNTMDIVREYGSQISKIISEPDSGMYDAINKGFSLASGKILAYLNSDDTYPPNALATVAHYFSINPGDICFGNCIFIDKEDREIFRYRAVDLTYANVCRLGRIPFAQPAAFWTRDLYDIVGGFDNTYKYVADTKFFLGCLKISNSGPKHIDDYLANFRLHDDAFSAVATQEMVNEHHRALNDFAIKVGVSRYALEAYVKWRNLTNLINKYNLNPCSLGKYSVNP